MIDQRSIIIFNHAISSQATKKSYFYQLKRFMEFHKIKSYNSLIAIEPKKLQVMIEDYIMNRSSKLERGSLRHSLSALCVLNVVGIFLLLSNWHDKNAECPYCLDEYDEYDD